MQKDVFICFIDYAKAFDRVQHKQLMHILNSLDLDGKDIRLIQNLYWEQAACMRVNNELSDYIKIGRGVRQGRVFSPDLFNLYSEMILKELEGLPGFSIGEHNINNLRYADDFFVLLAESEEKLQDLLNKVVVESKKKGLTINCKKTECLVVTKKKSPKCRLHIGEAIIKQVEKFNYLGSYSTENGKCDRD